MDDYDNLKEALNIIRSIRESDCWEFLLIGIRESIKDLMPEGGGK